MNYTKPFRLIGNRGNNAFAYDARGAQPTLFVPAIVEGNLEDVSPGDEVVFADFDENGSLQECKGLAQFIRGSYKGVPLIVMDNHNHAFYFWEEARALGQIQAGATLIHIDGHKDMREPPELYQGHTLEDAFRFTNDVLNVGNYIVPAVQNGTISEIQFVTSEAALEDGSFFERTNKILNLDLDYFAPELAYIDFKKAKQFILQHAQSAALITVCTSPFFIDQDLAIGRLLALFKD